MIRAAIADDQELVRAGFRMILDAQPDIEVVGEASDGHAILELVAEVDVDVVLMDIRMPGMDGLAATRRLSEQAPHPQILVLTTFDTDEYLYQALRSGAAGFLLKTARAAKLVEAVRSVAAGEALLDPSITRRLIESYVRRPVPGRTRDPRLESLTERELQVFETVGRGLSNAEIAAELVVSEATVKTHINRLFSKLGARDRVQVVVLAYETGVVMPGEE